MTAWLALSFQACFVMPLAAHPLEFPRATDHVAQTDGRTCPHGGARLRASVTARHCHVHRAASRHWFCKWPDSLAVLKIQLAAIRANV